MEIPKKIQPHKEEQGMEISNKHPLRLDSPRAWRTYIGGACLDRLHGAERGEITQFPEEWIMSVVEARNVGREHLTEGLSTLPEEGGLPLKTLVESDPVAYLGASHAKTWGGQLGVLVKLIDPAERLTVQVHPDKEKAMSLFQSPFGKTECWHILDTTETDGAPACIYLGFKEGISRKKWKELFDTQNIQGMLDCMHAIPVTKGDTILIHGGVPHAIGAGCFLAEIQEPTDLTIRIERVTPAGLTIPDAMCHQGLGFDVMFDCFDYEPVTQAQATSRWFIPQTTRYLPQQGRLTTLIGHETCTLFALEEITVTQSLHLPCPPVFCGLYILEGEGTLTANGKEQNIAKAQQYFIPAGTEELTFHSKKGNPLRILRFFGPQGG